MPDPIKFTISRDICAKAKTMAEEALEFRESVDAAFGWSGVVLDDTDMLTRGATQVVLLLHTCHADEGRSELLHAKLFSVLGEKSRSHAEGLFVCDDGAWCRTPSVSAGALHGILEVLRMAQSYFLLMADSHVPRNRNTITQELKIIHSKADAAFLEGAYLRDIGPRRAEIKAHNWCYGASDLVKDLWNQMATGISSVTKSFHRWGGIPMSSITQQGVSFLDCYIHTGTSDALFPRILLALPHARG